MNWLNDFRFGPMSRIVFGVGKAREAGALARELEGQAATAGGLKDSAARLDSALDEFNRTFDERSRAINDAGRGGAPGPMFGVQ